MEKINYNGKEGMFIPLNEFDKGKFFKEEELHKLQNNIVKQGNLIMELQQEVQHEKKRI